MAFMPAWVYILFIKRKEGFPMKKKLASLLAALLLCLSLLPAQALAASAPDPVPPPAVSENEEILRWTPPPKDPDPDNGEIN